MVSRDELSGTPAQVRIDRDQLIKLAASGKDMPAGLLLTEAMLFQATAYLYGRYRAGQIDLEQAKQDKQMIIETYNRAAGIE